MKNSEEAIEKVLAGLRDAEVPEGMERRILDALENVELVRVGSVWHRLLPLWFLAPAGAMTRVLVCGAALVGVVVVVFAASAIHHAGSLPVQSKKEIAPERLSPVSPSVVDAPSVAASSSRERRAGLRVRSAVGKTQLVQTVDSEDSVALSEMRAASFPAPPMPLTEQERLLLRIAHKGDPVEVALLDPNQRNLQEMKEKAEYQSFFARHAIEQPATGQTPEQAVPASDPADGKQLEGQQQIPSEEHNKNGNDNSENKTRERQNE
jgi:hypothetical protein